jgi:hypothetical protein
MKRFCMHIYTVRTTASGRQSERIYIYIIVASNGCFRGRKVRITRLYNTIHAHEYIVSATCVQQRTAVQDCFYATAPIISPGRVLIADDIRGKLEPTPLSGKLWS